MTTKPEVPTRWFFSDRALRKADLPRPLAQRAQRLAADGPRIGAYADVTIALTSELLAESPGLPGGALGADTWFLALNDLPVSALMQLPAALRLHRPDYRLHITDDPGSLRRLIVAQARRDPFEGIVDGFVVGETLHLLLGDLSSRAFPMRSIPGLDRVPLEARSSFHVDEDGSFLHWADHDLFLGVSQLLQAVDPAYLADVEIERYAKDHTGAAVSEMREARGLRQTDVRGLSERQVRRIEQGISRLTADAAATFATAFGQSLREFLDEMATRSGRRRAADGGAGRAQPSGPDANAPAVIA